MTADSSPATAPFRPACGWCDSTHIADVSCSCTTPCKQGWCPAVELDAAVLPNPRDAVA
jgi:hypothetical protein